MFSKNHNPAIGEPEKLAEGLQVVTAPNASPMTYTGTQSYILGEQEVAVIDPGPDSPAHMQALIAALAGRRVSHILITHSHIDHSPLAGALSRSTGAPIYGFGPSGAGMSDVMQRLVAAGGLEGGEGIDQDFSPDILLKDGDSVSGNGWGLKAFHTPGHMSNHLCFAGEVGLFSGDHVMGWSTTLVSPPDGDLTQFMASLQKLRGRPDETFFPGHGAPLHNPQQMLEYQYKHRQDREAQIQEALGETTIPLITRKVYQELDPRLLPMAERNVFAHLIDMCEKGIAACEGPIGITARYSGKN